MSSGACRALVAVLLTVVATVVLTFPIAAATEQLRERSLVTYEVSPSKGEIDVRLNLVLGNRTDQPVPAGEWGPIYLEEDARPGFRPRSVNRAGDFTPVPGLWKSMQIDIREIDRGGDELRVNIRYTIDAPIGGTGSARVPARVGDAYVYFCVPGQDADTGSVRVNLPRQFRTTQSGTQLEETDNGLFLRTSDPVDNFTCIEGVIPDRLEEAPFLGPDGRQFILQAWPEDLGWLVSAELQARPALDELQTVIGQAIPGDEPVIIREAPLRSLGGYASAHDKPGIVQLDERGGTTDFRYHELAHAWFGTNNFSEQWMREGMALWTASTFLDSVCVPVNGDDVSLDLADWQVVKPTAPTDIDIIIADQDAAVCGIVSAVASKMDAATWRTVMGSMLNGEAKYIGSDGTGSAPSATVDYREWLDAVDERGLVPAGNTDLDFAQDLLAAYGITPDPLLLRQRSETRARYHQFLADAAPLAAPAVVREAMDNWFFEQANDALDLSYEVLGALTEADALLPEAGLVPIIQPGFEAARNEQDLDAVRTQAVALLNSTEQVLPPLKDLQAAAPPGWSVPAAVRSAIADQRFDDIMASISPALQIVQEVSAAHAALPEAGLLEKYRVRYESTATATRLEELADAVAEERVQAELTGIAYTALQSEVGEWTIPAAVTNPIFAGQITTARSIVDDARGVVGAAKQADISLPEANLSGEIRPQFEAVSSAGEMQALRDTAEAARDDATAVGSALSSLRRRVPGWTIPDVVSVPVEERDFATAAQTAAVAQKWVEFAWQADQDLPDVIDALGRIKPEFESATTLAELQAGAALAENWATAASHVNSALLENAKPRGLLTRMGLIGTTVEPQLEEAVSAAIAGDVPLAIAKSAEVIEVLRNGSSSGGLRLAGLVFFGVAMVGVLGMWFLFRREAGPPWARQTKPHWIEDKPRLGRGKQSNDKDENKKK